MSSNSDRQAEVVIYVGTHKLIALESLMDRQEPLVARHVIQKNPEGFEKGFVTNLERAACSLECLLDSLFEGRKRPEVNPFIVLGNSKIKGYSFSSSQYYQGFQRTVSSQEIRSVVSQTRSVATLPLSEFVLQAVPESFIVNDTENVTNPLGLEAHRLGVNLKIFTMNFQDFKNLSKAFEAAEIEPQAFFPKAMTVSEAVLSEEEKETGTLLIDISDDAAHFILWKKGHMMNDRIIPAGSRLLSERIAEIWGIDARDAERVKEQFGSLTAESDFGDELIPLIERNGKGSHSIRRGDFQAEFLKQAEEWLGEILKQADQFTKDSKIHYPNLVFSGGGASADSFLEFVQRRFSRSARIGVTKRIEAPSEILVDSSLTGALGMLRWLSEHSQEQKRLVAPSGFLQKTIASARDWFSAYF